jgi:hypothetical protein
MSNAKVQMPSQILRILQLKIKKHFSALDVLYLEFSLSVFYQDFFHLIFVGQFLLLQNLNLCLILRRKERLLFQSLQLPCKFAVALLCL